MQTAHITLALGGDVGNTVPKYHVTPAEVAVMRAIHGTEAVFDIDPQPGKKLNSDGGEMTNRQELGRLRAVYGAAKDSENNSIIDGLYPGAAARVFETFDELELDESFFKPVTRRSARSPEAAPVAPAKAGRKPKAGAKPPEEPEPEIVEEDEEIDAAGDAEIGSMPDGEPAANQLFA